MAEWMRAEEATIPQHLVDNADRAADHVVHTCDDQQVTNEELLVGSYSFANAYRELGVGPGDVVASFMENRVEHAYSWGACSFLGAGHLPCNTFLRGDF